MPQTIATVLINEFGETEAATPIGALPMALVVLENGTFAALVQGNTERDMGTTRLRLSGSLEPVSDHWRYVDSCAHGMGVWHLWTDINHSDQQMQAYLQAQEDNPREHNEQPGQATDEDRAEAGETGEADPDTPADTGDGTTPADHD